MKERIARGVSGALSSLPPRIGIASREREDAERAALQARIEVAAGAVMARFEGRPADGRRPFA